MTNSTRNQNKNSNPNLRREIVGYRLVAMRADQVDEIAKAEGRDVHPKWHSNVTDKRLRCRWCFLKGGVKGNHFCRWRTANNEHAPPDGGPARRVPIYQWVED